MTGDLSHVRWLGGGSGAGKSTVARALAARHGLHLVDTDALMADHAARTPPEQAPELTRFMAMSMDERWLLRTPEEMLDTFHWFRGEAFEALVDDLLALAPRPGAASVLVEGFRLLPRLVAPLLAAPSHALWLLPTPGFRVRALTERGSLHTVAGRTSDPGRALANLLARDGAFTGRLRGECTELCLATVEVDGSLGLDDLVERVEAALGL